MALGVAAAAACVVAAVLLWDTSVPGGLNAHVDVDRTFGSAIVDRAASFEAFVHVVFVLSQLALVIVLGIYARYGMRFMKESAAGPIGTGFLLGMLGLALVWLAQLPFGLAELWWARRHHVIDANYLDFVFGEWFSLGGAFVFLCAALLVVMGLAKLLRRTWWVPAATIFASLIALFAFVSPYLTPLRAPHGPELRREGRAVARAEGLGDVPLRVMEVHQYTDQPNAFATGLGGSRRVVLFDTIIDFPRRDVRSVIAHEYGHLAHHHVAKKLGWSIVLMIPALLIVGLVARRRGGLSRPEAIPLVLFVATVLQLIGTPIQSTVSRRYEAEADYQALQTTCDPAAMRDLNVRFTERLRADPDPPGWFHVLFDDHPSGAERVEMATAWQRRQARPGARPCRPAVR